jgi:hypothetical protein
MGGNDCFRIVVSKFMQGFVVEMHLKVKGADTVVDCVVLYNFVCCFVPIYLYEMV